MNLLTFFLILLKGSLFSTSGTGNVPILHDDLVPRGWATEHQFAEALAVGQISPGPSGLWVISLGYLTAGWRGCLLAFVAITIPPLLILAVDRIYRRVQHHPAVEGFVRGLGLAVVAVFVVVMARLIFSTGLSVRTASIALCGFLLTRHGRVPVPVIITMGAAAGILFWK